MRMRILAAVVAAGCAGGMEVRSSTAGDVSFARLETYAWAPPGGTRDERIDDERLARRVRRAVDRKLALEGYRKVAREKADFVVDYRAVLEREREVEEVGDGGYGLEDASTRRGEGETRVDDPDREARGYAVHVYEIVKLSLFIEEAETGRFLWSASARTELDDPLVPLLPDTQVQEAVNRMLNRLPR